MEERSVHSSDNDINSEEVMKDEPLKTLRKKRICLVGGASEDPTLEIAAHNFNVPVLKSQTGFEYIEDTEFCTYFILQEFEGDKYEKLRKSAHRILGPTALLQLVGKGEMLPSNNRPMYTQSMVGTVVALTGFRNKDELTRLINMIHNMGGSIRKEIGAEVTHLIANCSDGEKYRYAVIFRVPIMSVNWIITLWNMRNDVTCSGTSEQIVSYYSVAGKIEEPCVHGSVSNMNTEEMATNESLKIPRKRRICLVGAASEDFALCVAAQKFSVPVLKSQSGFEHIDDMTFCTYFILKEFEGPEYDKLYKSAHRILGPTALLQLAGRKEILPSNNRPMYTQSMAGTVVAFTGFRKKDELTRLINMIHNMGGSIRKEIGAKVTHLIANCCAGEKYRFAVTFRVPIMSMNWITTLWDMRNDITCNGTNEEFISAYKLKPFYGAKVCLFGFPEDERKHMYEVLHQQGGDSTEIDDPNCTHVVVDESNVNVLPDLASVRAHIVKAEWFWSSVQNEGAADEKEYLFEDYLESMMSPSVSMRIESQQTTTPNSTSTRRKRKRLPEIISSLSQSGIDSPALHKRRSSISDAGHLSVSGSFLDCTASPDKQLLDDIPEVESVNIEPPRRNLSPRHQVFLELVQTESNYVGILNTIMTLFKHPLEVLIDKKGEMLNATEARTIFGNFPPIHVVHEKMLTQLKYLAVNWTEDVSIGNIFLNYKNDLKEAYPPYVNYFENTKEMLDHCDQNKPRFHAFLKICQTKPECGRQSLKELLIKPVQRLPSISLLLNDILKHTHKSNPDHSALEQAISSIKEVMTHINEDKRKTEGQLVMFDIFNEIDNCPPHLVSSHRSFIGKCDVMELSEGLSGRGDHLVLFLFTDILEICKKRSKAFNSLKSPNTVNGLHSAKLTSKPYKHIKMLSLSTIKRVVDIRETDDCHKVFALMVRNNQELREKLYSFTITDEGVNKSNFLRTLCRQMANTVCKTDADNLLITLDSHQLEIDTSDVALGTLSKAFKFASRTRMKVGRAFSFNKTPSKLKRAMSTMMSPFGSTHSLTPASQQLAQMRLASCNNINIQTNKIIDD